MKNPCADESPVVRVPVTPSGVFDFRVLCVSGFCSPARFVRPGRSCGMSGWIPSRRRPDLQLPVAGRPSQPSRFRRLAPTSGLSTLELSTFDFQLLAVWLLFCHITPLQSALTQKRTRKSFGMCSCKSLDLKSPGMNTYEKYRGGGASALVANTGLSPYFSPRTPDKGFKFGGSIFVLRCFHPSHPLAPSPYADTSAGRHGEATVPSNSSGGGNLTALASATSINNLNALPSSELGAIEQARDWVASARSIAVLTGAGISAESGVPTFRGVGGLWRNFRPEELATPSAFARDPKLVWEWYDWRRSVIAGAAQIGRA